MNKTLFLCVILYYSIQNTSPLTMAIIEQKVQDKNYVSALLDLETVQHHVRITQLSTLFELKNQVLQGLQLPIPPAWKNYIQIVLLCIPIVLIQLIIIVCLLLLLFSFFVPCMRRYIKQAIVILTVCFGLWFLQYQYIFKPKAFVVKTPAFVYAGPEQSFHKLFELKLGSSVHIIKQSKNMYQIESGWIMAHDVKIV